MRTQILQSIEKELELIPFIDIIQPYAKHFLYHPEICVSDDIKEKLYLNLLKELSNSAEVTLQYELDQFVLKGNSLLELFVEEMNTHLKSSYPVLDKILTRKTNNFCNHVRKILKRFENDREEIIKTFNLNSEISLKDIDVSLGDGHNGEGTAMIFLSNDTKLIYKPRNVSITNTYNHFIDWINLRLHSELKTFKTLDCDSYGWLEFVKKEDINSKEELQEYYYKAGILLAVTYLLGSKDCHRENVIASGNSPVNIDQETIIQPHLSTNSLQAWDRQNNIPQFSVLECALIVNQGTGVPYDIAGFGTTGNLEFAEIDKKVINPNTINSKRTTRFASKSLVENNIPAFNGKYIFASDYKQDFINGFSAAYELFLRHKKELISEKSPIQLFRNKEVRYVWRPTFVYFRILKYLRGADFMASFESYENKLHDLLSKAYAADEMKDYRFILNDEMKQMMNGDIPIFNLTSEQKHLKGSPSEDLFQFSCIENILHRIAILSEENKEEQLNLINQWLSI